MATVKKTWRIDEDVMKDIETIAKESADSNVNQIVETALKQYRDNYYMKNKSTIINEEIINILKSTINVSEHRINFKTNKFLSELVVQTVITNLIIAKSLEVSLNIMLLKI